MSCPPGVNIYTANHANVGNANFSGRFVSLVRHNATAMEPFEISIHKCTTTSTTIVIRNHGEADRDVTANIFIVCE